MPEITPVEPDSGNADVGINWTICPYRWVKIDAIPVYAIFKEFTHA